MTNEAIADLGGRVREVLQYFVCDPSMRSRRIAWRGDMRIGLVYEIDPSASLRYLTIELARPPILDFLETANSVSGLIIEAAWGVMFNHALQMVMRFEAEERAQLLNEVEDRMDRIAAWTAGQFKDLDALDPMD